MGRLSRGLRAFIAVLLLSFAYAGAPLESAKIKGVYHQVRKGQTLYMIARAYQVPVAVLIKANGIDEPDKLPAGRILFIPGAERVLENIVAAPLPPERGMPAGEALATATPSAAHDTATMTTRAVPSTGSPASKATATTQVTTADSAPPQAAETAAPEAAQVHTAVPQSPQRPRFIWPLRGRVVSCFGRQRDGMYFNGIDIAGREGEPVLAAASGRVTFSAPLKGYGETIIIAHAENYATVYTRLGTRLVKPAEQIEQGRQIALLGKPDSSGESRLNFGIWHRNKAQDPLAFLP